MANTNAATAAGDAPRDHEQEQYEHEAACAQFVSDAAAFIRFMLAQPDMSWPEVQQTITATLTHDVGGLANRERCFLPRVSGYANKEAQGELAALLMRLGEKGGAA